MSLLIGTDNTFTRIGSVFANKPGDYIYLEGKCPCCESRILKLLGWRVSFIIGLDNIFVRIVIVLYFSDALLAGVFQSTTYYLWNRSRCLETLLEIGCPNQVYHNILYDILS